ncbi:MAG: ABC transporter permease [Acidobacteria bacterium]|nr:MAG: ABC transporter permease [Acidobacteriota bacterium]
MNGVWQDVRLALRTLRLQPGFVAIALTTLALGIGATTAMFTVVNGVLLRPLPFRDPKAVALVRIAGMQGGIFPLPDADFLAWRANHPAFDHVAVFTNTSFNLTGSGSPEVVRAASVSSDFFTTLGVAPYLGRLFTDGEDAPGAGRFIVLAHSYWTARFGADRSVLGRTLRLNDETCTIVGVAPPRFVFPRADIDLWRNLTIGVPPRRGPFYLTGVARLNTDIAAGRANLETVSREILRQYGGAKDWNFEVLPMTDALVGDARTPLYLLLAAVGVLLLIALTNVANLLLSRSTARQREMAVRAALGAGRARLVRQLLTEAALLSLAGGALGLLLAIWLTHALLTLGETNIPRLADIRLDSRVFAFTAIISIAAGLLFGTAPALHASGGDLAASLRDGQRAGTSRRHRHAQRVLVIAEVALALVLSIGAGLLVRSLMRLEHVDAGFNPQRLLTFALDLPEARYKDSASMRSFYERLIDRLQALPAVESAALAVSLPPDQLTVTDNFTAEGRTYLPGESAPVGTMVVSSDSYFKTLAIPLLNGRVFDRREQAESEPVVIVSRTLAERYYPTGAIGRHFRTGGPERPNNKWMRIVGVVGDVKYDGLAVTPEPAYYLPFRQHSWSSQFIVVRTAGSPAAAADSVRQAVWSIDRDLPLGRLRTMDELMARASGESRFRTFVLASFGLLGLVLALVGVYGVMAYSVSQRRQELGIRAALGARRTDLVSLVLKDAGVMAVTGVAIGLIGAFFATRLTETLLFGVSPKDPATFAFVAAVLMMAALVASWLPARKAARVEPVTAMRG